MSDKYKSKNYSDTQEVDKMNVINNDYDVVNDIDVVG